MIVKKFLTVIQVLLVLVFFICALYIAKYFYDANKAQEQFELLSTEISSPEFTDASGNYEEKYADNGMLVQYYELYQKNSDLAGWLRIKNTVIDYPVVQTDNNEFYLHRDFYKQNQFSGTPFLDSDCSPETMNKIIYAHNMKNGTMFAAISNYEDKDFLNDHRIITFDTLYERGEYEIISVFRTTVGSKNEFKYHEYADIRDEIIYNDYVRAVKALSVHPTNTMAFYGDELITLSTCAYHTSNERIVVVARKIKN